MKPHEIEYRVLRIIEQVEAHRKVEDSRVELKTNWIDHIKAARQIAGHANAAGGELILWIIGIDEEDGVRGIDNTEISEWLNQVKSQFDDLPVVLQHNLTIPYKDKSVIALLFETDRAPYVVKNPRGENPHREVPWREGNETRTATRMDLLKILSPLQLEPRCEIVTSKFLVPEVLVDGNGHHHPNGLFLDLFIEPLGSTPVTIPLHRCEFSLREEGSNEWLQFGMVFFNHSGMGLRPGGNPSSQGVVVSSTEVTVFNPGMMAIHAILVREIAETLESEHLEVDLFLGITGLDRKLPIRMTLESYGDSGDGTRIWKMVLK